MEPASSEAGHCWRLDVKATGSEGDGRLEMLFGDSQLERQSVIKSKKLDRIPNTTRRKSWRNATGKDGRA